MDWIGFSYAAFVGTGGFIGYFKAGSVASLISGLVFGLSAALGAYRVSKNPKDLSLSFITSGFLAVLMGIRFYMSRTFFPAGLMTLISTMMTVKIVSGMIKTEQRKFSSQ